MGKREGGREGETRGGRRRAIKAARRERGGGGLRPARALSEATAATAAATDRRHKGQLRLGRGLGILRNQTIPFVVDGLDGSMSYDRNLLYDPKDII